MATETVTQVSNSVSIIVRVISSVKPTVPIFLNDYYVFNVTENAPAGNNYLLNDSSYENFKFYVKILYTNKRIFELRHFSAINNIFARH